MDGGWLLPTLLPEGAQLDPHFLQRLLQVGAAGAFLLQGQLHVPVLQGHGGRRGQRHQGPVGGGAHVLPATPKYTLGRGSSHVNTSGAWKKKKN